MSLWFCMPFSAFLKILFGWKGIKVLFCWKGSCNTFFIKYCHLQICNDWPFFPQLFASERSLLLHTVVMPWWKVMTARIDSWYRDVDAVAGSWIHVEPADTKYFAICHFCLAFMHRHCFLLVLECFKDSRYHIYLVVRWNYWNARRIPPNGKRVIIRSHSSFQFKILRLSWLVPGSRRVGGVGKRKKEGEPVIISFTTLFHPLLARLR